MANKKDLVKALEDPKLRAELKKLGFSVRRDTNDLVVKSFKLPRDLADQFHKTAKERGLKVQDAAEQALRDWLKTK